MQPVFAKEYPLRAGDFDCRQRWQPAAIMDLFQDAAGCHALELGVGFPQLSARNQMWILSGVRFEVVATPKMYQTVRVVTWPLPAHSVTCRRDFRIEATDGTLLVKGTSDWAIMDGEKRKLVRAREIYPADLAYCEDVCFDGKMPRLADFEPQNDGMTFVPGYAELDMNGHVNNTKYANFILNAVNLAEDQEIRVFHIHYRKELLAYQPFFIQVRREENILCVMGKNGDGVTMFSAQIQLK